LRPGLTPLPPRFGFREQGIHTRLRRPGATTARGWRRRGASRKAPGPPPRSGGARDEAQPRSARTRRRIARRARGRPGLHCVSRRGRKRRNRCRRFSNINGCPGSSRRPPVRQPAMRTTAFPAVRYKRTVFSKDGANGINSGMVAPNLGGAGRGPRRARPAAGPAPAGGRDMAPRTGRAGADGASGHIGRGASGHIVARRARARLRAWYRRSKAGQGHTRAPGTGPTGTSFAGPKSKFSLVMESFPRPSG
jgi:hypothetical protein